MGFDADADGAASLPPGGILRTPLHVGGRPVGSARRADR